MVRQAGATLIQCCPADERPSSAATLRKAPVSGRTVDATAAGGRLVRSVSLSGGGQDAPSSPPAAGKSSSSSSSRTAGRCAQDESLKTTLECCDLCSTELGLHRLCCCWIWPPGGSFHNTVPRWMVAAAARRASAARQAASSRSVLAPVAAQTAHHTWQSRLLPWMYACCHAEWPHPLICRLSPPCCQSWLHPTPCSLCCLAGWPAS